MMQNAVKLNLPSLSDTDAELIKQEFSHNVSYLSKVTSNNSKDLFNYPITDTKKDGYYNLINWPNKSQFVKMIFEKYGVSDVFLNYITIQKSVNELPPHIDYQRKFGLICIIDGSADTAFYVPRDKTTQKKLYKKHELVETERYHFELNCWYAFNNSAIHGVDNYRGERISLSLSLTDTGLFKDYADMINNMDKVLSIFRHEELPTS